MASLSKKQRLSDLLKKIRSDKSIEIFIKESLSSIISYAAYYDWEAARSYPSPTRWNKLWPILCEISGLEKIEIERYLDGSCSLEELFSIKIAPVPQPELTLNRFRLWITTLSLTDLLIILSDVTSQITLLTGSGVREKNTLKKNKLSVKDEQINNIFEILQSLSLQKMTQVLSWGHDIVSIRLKQELPYFRGEYIKLSELLADKNLDEIAEQFDMDRERLQQMANNTLRPTDVEVVSIAAALNIPSENLIKFCDFEFGQLSNEERLKTNGR